MDKGKEHRLQLDARKVLTINRVIHVETFNENQILLDTDLGRLDIKGENLDIKKLNIDEGNLEIHGLIKSILYSEGGGERGKSLLKKIFR